MGMNRRQLLGVMAAGAAKAWAQRNGGGPKPRSSPALCLFSEQLPKVPYDELGDILRGLGFEGCDLAVQEGGHISLQHLDLDLERGVEAITGSGLDVPVLSTTFTSPSDVTVRTVLGWGGEMGIPIFRPGHWPAAGDSQARMVQAQREIFGLAQLCGAVGMQMALHNSTPEFVGAKVAEIDALIRGLNPKVAGYDFDIGYATAQAGAAGWVASLQLALPRLKMVTARDLKAAGGTFVQCPLGEGMVDWPQFFSVLAKGNFTGPVSLQLEYQVKDELAAIRRDLDFLKKARAAAYGG
jgi:L-ribulose-5-phosphate 3-epimerase